MSDVSAPSLLCHGQARRHRGLGRHRGQRGEGVQVSHQQRPHHFSNALSLMRYCNRAADFIRAYTY